jgi:tetratricopeptide (TPR) repeat protein
MGDASGRYTATTGCGTYLPRIALAELVLQMGDLAQARELLDWCLQEHPGFYGTVLPYATVLLRTGTDPEAVVAELEERITELTPTVRFMLGTALYECGASTEAERQFRLVLERQPNSAQSRVAVGETLLSLRRYDEAAEQAAQVPEDSPLAANASRTELFGRIVGADIDGATSALTKAERAGLPVAEHELFKSWLTLLSGETLDHDLPSAGVGLLEVILEALLRVQEFKAFEVLVPLLERTDLPQREQRELLASLYLRRGFLQSAAKEWMDVCALQPDPRALVGLAKVALAHGLPEDAVVFAHEALALEPANAEASAIAASGQQAAAA